MLGLMLVRRGSDPVHPAATGAALGAACGACAGVMVELWCPVGAPRHVAVGHILPIVVVAILGASVGARFIAMRCARLGSAAGRRPEQVRAFDFSTPSPRSFVSAWGGPARNVQGRQRAADASSPGRTPMKHYYILPLLIALPACNGDDSNPNSGAPGNDASLADSTADDGGAAVDDSTGSATPDSGARLTTAWLRRCTVSERRVRRGARSFGTRPTRRPSPMPPTRQPKLTPSDGADARLRGTSLPWSTP